MDGAAGVVERGGVQMWHRLGDVLRPWYDEIHEHCLEGAKLHADETGWRVEGQTHWLHLLRDVAAVDETSAGDPEWASFCRRLVGVYRDAKKLHATRPTAPAETYDLSIHRLEGRLIKLGTETWTPSGCPSTASNC